MGCTNSTANKTDSNEPVSAASQPKHNYTLFTNELQRKVFEELKGIARIPELDQPTTVGSVRYSEKDMAEVLYPVIDDAQVIMVAGAFFGDEGKGKTVDAVAKHKDCVIVARTNSGENAGHTVFSQGKKFVFHLAPSAVLLEGKRNLVGPECVMDPISFMNKEVKQLIDAGVNYKERLFIGNVHIVAPYHKLLDMLTSLPNSSTLKGMSPVHSSKVTKKGLRLDHIFGSEATMRSRLARDLETYYGVLKVKNLTDAQVVERCKQENSDGVIRVPDYVLEFAQAEDKVEHLVRLFVDKVRNNDQFPNRCDVPHEIRKALEDGKKVLLEGPQSYWLSNARDKFWESSTSADTSAAGLLATAQFNFQKYKSVVINVHKTPGTSRVGVGANPSAFVPQDYFSIQDIRTLRDLPDGMCTDFENIQKKWSECVTANGIIEPIEFEDASGKYNIGVAMAVACSRHHGESGATTQKPRVTGLFDCVAHYEVNSVQGPYLSISALDRGDDHDDLGVCIAYVYHDPNGVELTCNGKVYKSGDIIKAGDPFPTEAVLYKCHPIVKIIKGWKGSPIAATKRTPGTPLPQGVCDFVATVEHFTGAHVISIGNGPEGANIIYLQKE